MFAHDFDVATFKKGFDKNLEGGPAPIRMAVRQAKKYSLDVNASKQISDLGSPRHWDDMQGLRRMARLPCDKIWVEFDNKARRNRLIEINDIRALPMQVGNADEVVPQMAWLIERHPDQPSSHRVTVVMHISDFSFEKALMDEPDPFFRKRLKGLSQIQPLPIAFTWETDDLPNKYGQAVIASANSAKVRLGDRSDQAITIRADIPEILTGRVGNKDEFVGVTKGYGKNCHVGSFYKGLSAEFSGELRYVMAFVAALGTTQVINSNSQVVLPSQRQASGHSTPSYTFTEVRITVPRRRKLAKYIRDRAEAGMSGIKMRHHDVEDHWRTYEHGAGPFCTSGHVFEAASVPDKENCKQCTAWRTRVRLPNGRGDKSLGRVEHSYRVTA